MMPLFPLVNFPNGTTAMVFTLLFFFILLLELRILLRDKSRKDDKKSMYLILFGIFMPLVVSIILSFSNIGSLPAGFSYFGILILCFGFLLRQFSIAILGRFFTPVVQKVKKQKIIRDGPYKYIRHPSYTGLILELLGVSLALTNWISFLVTIIIFLPIISYRINIEEKFLERNFESYKDYKQKTKKLIPFIY